MRGLCGDSPMDELCETMGASVSKQAISKYEKGKMLPNSTVLIQLAKRPLCEYRLFFQAI